MEAETPKERKRLRQKLEGLRENLVSTAVREPGLRKRQVTVGRTPLGECLRQPREAPEGSQEGLKLIDGVELLRERAAQKKKKESLRLEAANQDGGGGNNKTVPARQREGLTGGPREENQQPQPPALAPEETPPEGKDRDASDLQKREMEVGQQPDLGGEDQDPGDDAGDQGSGDDSNGDGSECSSDDKEASDPQKSGAAEADREPGAGGEAQDSGDEEAEESSEEVCSDEDDDSEDSSDEEAEDVCSDSDDNSEDSSDVDDYDEDKDKGARCDALWVIEWKVKCDLKKKVIHLWSAVWETPLQAVTALQETLNRFLPATLTALKKESDCLRGFLQAIQSHGTVEKMADLSIVHHLQNALQDFPVIKMGAPYGVPLKEEDAIKQGMDTWYSALLHVLLKQVQEKVDALQEKVDAVQNISLKQVAILKVKIGAVQKQMGALSKIPLKEMMILIAVVHELSCAFGSSKEWNNTLWNKARDQVFTLKTHKGDALQELHPLWKKLDALQEALCCSPIKKLEILKEKAKVLLRKVGALQGNLLNPLKKELQLLEDKLRSLRDTSLEELEEELDDLQETLDWMQYCRDYPLEEEVGTLQKKMGALQKKVGAWQKTNAPLKEAEGVMETEGSSFSETLKAPEAGAKQNAGARRITDQPANIVAKMAVSSLFETTNFLENAGQSSGSTGNLRGSVSASVPPSSTGVRKMWHGEITLEERHRRVHKFAENISPVNDSTAAREKLTAYIKQIEEDMFELANSKMEYHQLMAEKLDAIQKNLDQSLRSSLPNQGISSNDLQASRTHPGVISPVAVTTGQAQTLILPTGKRPFSGVEAAEKTSVALQIPETTNLNRSKTQDPQQPEEAMSAKSSEDSLADCEPTMTETEPPYKKQKMDPVERTQVALFAQELYAALQKYIKYVTVTITQNTEKVGDLMGRLYGSPNQASALKDTEDAKALTSTLKKSIGTF